MNGLPLVVSYYTVNTPYEGMADRLRRSCERLGLHKHIVPLPSQGSWTANTYAKARVCQYAWQLLLQTPILWVDADAVIHSVPELLRGSTVDFAVHQWKGQYFSSGTVFFNQTPKAGQILNGWVERCRTQTGESDQPHLELAWKDVEDVNTLWLPRSYYQIFDAPQIDGPPVIEHFQASRMQNPNWKGKVKRQLEAVR